MSKRRKKPRRRGGVREELRVMVRCEECGREQTNRLAHMGVSAAPCIGCPNVYAVYA